MKKLMLLATMMVTLANHAWGMEYERPVTLVGVLKSSKGETPDGKSVQFPSLQLVSPITVTAKPGSDDVTEKGVVLIQLALSEPLMMRYRSLKNKKAQVVCSLFHSDNGNHYTNVLCDASSINAR